MSKRNLKHLAIHIIIAMAFFPFSQNLILLGRKQIYTDTGTITNAGYLRRVDIALDAIKNINTRLKETTPVQSWWVRLDYAGPQVAAIRFRENGIKNTSTKDIPYYLIPRLIWPNKPILLPPGLRFYHLVSGNEGVSFLGLSIYGDLFWLAGSFGIIVGGMAIGLLFGYFSIRSLHIIRRQNFVYFPLVLLPFKASILGITDFVSSGIIGWLPIYFGYALFINLGMTLISTQTRFSRV